MKLLPVIFVVIAVASGICHAKGPRSGQSPVVVVVGSEGDSARHFESHERDFYGLHHHTRGKWDDEENHHYHYIPVNKGPARPWIPPYRYWKAPKCESWDLTVTDRKPELVALIVKILAAMVAAAAE